MAGAGSRPLLWFNPLGNRTMTTETGFGQTMGGIGTPTIHGDGLLFIMAGGGTIHDTDGFGIQTGYGAPRGCAGGHGKITVAGRLCRQAHASPRERAGLIVVLVLDSILAFTCHGRVSLSFTTGIFTIVIGIGTA